MTSRAVVLALGLSVALPAVKARADAPAAGGTPAALSEALFREGRQRMTDGSYGEACPKLAESQRLDPHLGTLLNLAFCHAHQGLTATAWAEYAQAAAEAQRAGRKENEATAREQMKSLDAVLSRITLVAPSPPPGLEVTLDGAALGAGALGSSLPVDPGHHEFVARAPGLTSARWTVDALPGPSSQIVKVPELESPVPAPDAPSPPAEPALRSWYVGPIVFGGLTLVGAGLGTYFGLAAISKNTIASKECPQGQCSGPGLTDDHAARVDATASTVAFGVAAAAAVTSVVWFVIDRRQSGRLRATAGPMRLGLEGSF